MVKVWRGGGGGAAPGAQPHRHRRVHHRRQGSGTCSHKKEILRKNTAYKQH